MAQSLACSKSALIDPGPMNKMPVRLASLSLVLAAALTGCSSPGADAPADSPPAAAPPAASSPASTDTASPSVQTVDPNTATTEELTAALASAGVDNPDRWAEEVQEYGPYTAENLEPTLTEELGKYGISQDQLSKVLSALKVE
jgi:ABC-type transport system substrate-binding protein